MEQATLIVRKKWLPLDFNRWAIVVDGSEIGYVSAGQETSLFISPGVHSIYIECCRRPRGLAITNRLEINVAPGSSLYLETDANWLRLSLLAPLFVYALILLKLRIPTHSINFYIFLAATLAVFGSFAMPGGNHYLKLKGRH